MDYDKIIELINSGPEGRAELDRIAAPKPVVNAGPFVPQPDEAEEREWRSYLAKLSQSSEVSSSSETLYSYRDNTDEVVAPTSRPTPKGLTPLGWQHDIEEDVQKDSLLVRRRQSRIESVIERIEAPQGIGALPALTKDLGQEVTMYQATESEIVWPTVQATLPSDQISRAAHTARARGYEMIARTSEAINSLNYDQRLPEDYKTQIARLFEAERAEIRYTVEPILNADAVQEVRRNLSAFYPTELETGPIPSEPKKAALIDFEQELGM